MIQCNICHDEYDNTKDMYRHVMEEKNKINNMYKDFCTPIESIGSVVGHTNHSPIDLQQESKFKKFENSIDSIKKNQKNRYQQRIILSAQPLVTRSPSTTISSPFNNERTSVGGCSDTGSRCSTSSAGNGSNKSHDENTIKKFKIFDNCCKKCNKTTEYLCINMNLRHPLCKDCYDNYSKKKFFDIEKIIKKGEENIENCDIDICSKIKENDNEYVIIDGEVHDSRE